MVVISISNMTVRMIIPSVRPRGMAGASGIVVVDASLLDEAFFSILKFVFFVFEVPHAVAVIVAVDSFMPQSGGIIQHIPVYLIVLLPPQEPQSVGCVSVTFISRLQLPYP